MFNMTPFAKLFFGEQKIKNESGSISKLRKIMPELLKLKENLKQITRDEPSIAITSFFSLLSEHNNEKNIKKLEKICLELETTDRTLCALLLQLTVIFMGTQSSLNGNNRTRVGNFVTIDSIYIHMWPGDKMASLSYWLSNGQKERLDSQIREVINIPIHNIINLIGSIRNHVEMD